MAGNPENTAPPEQTIIGMLEVLALTQIALDPNAPRDTRAEARYRAARGLGLDAIRRLP